jgi:hypothetical protein
MFAWDRMMRAALSAGIPPAAFWCLSLKEWRWLAQGRGTGGLDGQAFEALRRACQDQDTEGDKNG